MALSTGAIDGADIHPRWMPPSRSVPAKPAEKAAPASPLRSFLVRGEHFSDMRGSRQPAAIGPITAAKPPYRKRTGAAHQTTPNCTSRAGSLPISGHPPVLSEWPTIHSKHETLASQNGILESKLAGASVVWLFALT